MLGLTHPGQVEHEPAGTNPRMWGLTQLPSYGHSGGTGSSWGPCWLRKVHFSWGFISRPWLGGAAVEVPAGACAGSSPVPAGSAESWEQQPQPGEFGSCLLSLQTGNVLGEAVPRDPEVSLVTGTSCSRQHGTRRP